jgi:large subunit ribosomal protein L32e
MAFTSSTKQARGSSNMELLHLRKAIKAKKPDFTRQESHRKKKLDDGTWRKPRGIHSKMRLRIRGKRASPSPGYGSPLEVEGLHPRGLNPVVVHTLHDIDKLQKNDGAVIGSTVGMRGRARLMEHARKNNVVVLNIKNVDAFLKSVESRMNERKNAKKKSKVVEKKEEKKERDTKQPLPQPTPSDEEQKRKEKEEKDKLLTKRV